MSTLNVRQYICPEEGCSSTFKTLSHMTTHLLVHSTERPFTCTSNDCVASFKRVSHLQRHQQVCHGEKISFCCPHEGCNMTLCSAASLARHESRKHLNPKYKCSFCGVTMCKKKQLQIHEAQHQDAEPFKCDVEGCDRAFATPNRLVIHQKQHKGYECSVPGCLAKYFKWSLLLQHRKTDHPREFPCSQCDKKFLSSFNLKKHLHVHSETREVHHCPHENCPRQYFDFKNLNAHLKRFHQEQCFVCSHENCGRRFAHKKSLCSHLESHLNPKTKKPRAKRNKLYQFVKRRSAAAMLSGHNPEREEEAVILKRDRELTLENVRKQIEELQKSRSTDIPMSVDSNSLQQSLIVQEA